MNNVNPFSLAQSDPQELLAWAISFVRNDLILPVDFGIALQEIGVDPETLDALVDLTDRVQSFDEEFEEFQAASGLDHDTLNTINIMAGLEFLGVNAEAGVDADFDNVVGGTD